VRSKNDPHYFNSVVLKRSKYWGSKHSPQPGYGGQIEWCEAITKYHTLAIETGNAVGKDYWIAGIICWWLWTRPGSMVFVTGPGQTAIGSVTWKELRKAAEKCPLYRLGKLVAKISQGIKVSPAVFEISPGHHALGFSTTTVERASGHHAGQILVIVEEASGVDELGWEAIDGLAPTKIVAIGNPLQADGGFAKLCDQGDADARDGIPPHKAVKHFNVPSTASPHAIMESSPVGLASRSWLEQMARKWGVNSLWYKAHVAAIRPKVSSQILIPPEHLFFAYKEKRPVLPPHHPIHATRRLAVDLSEGVGRDSSCVIVRDNLGVLECVYGATLGLSEAADLMFKMGNNWKIPPERMSYDCLGIGKKLPNHLAKYNLQGVRPYAGSGSPRDKSFTNLRSEAAWRLKCRLDPEHVPNMARPHEIQEPFSFCSGAYQEKLAAQLKPLTYELHGQHTKLLNKEDWLEILGFSPDIADALIQSFAY
jgi:hypothetical protein